MGLDRAFVVRVTMLASCLTLGCPLAAEKTEKVEPQRASPSSTKAQPTKPASEAKSSRSRRTGWKPARIVAAPKNVEIQTYLAAMWQSAKKERRDLVVYVGADWCDPCVRFTRTVEREQLAEDLADFFFVKFDRDLDKKRLEAAGYSPVKSIPWFAVPRPDGRSSGQQGGFGIKDKSSIAKLGRWLDTKVQKARDVWAPPGRHQD